MTAHSIPANFRSAIDALAQGGVSQTDTRLLLSAECAEIFQSAGCKRPYAALTRALWRRDAYKARIAARRILLRLNTSVN